MTPLQQKTHDAFQNLYEVLANVANTNLGTPAGARVMALRDVLYDLVRLLSHEGVTAQPDAFRVLKTEAHMAVSRMKALKAEAGSTLKVEKPMSKTGGALDKAVAVAGKFLPGICPA